MSANFYDKDGRGFLIQVFGDERWQKGMAAAGLDRALADAGCAKLSDVANSSEKQKTFFDTMDRLFATDTRERWVKAFREANIVCAPINTLAEAATDPQVIANDYVIEVDHPKAGKIREVGFPWRFSKTPARAGIAPELGEHNDEVLKGLGYSDADIAQLGEEGVI